MSSATHPPFPVSDHCDGRRFFNLPGGRPTASPADVPKLLWGRVRGPGPAVWPAELPPPLTPELPPDVPAGHVAVTFVGHSTFLLQLPGLTVLTDPVFASHAGPFGRFGPRRARPPALQLAQLPPIDAVLLSHNHYDHLDLPALRWLAKERQPLVITTLGNKAWLEGHGVGRVVELDWWQAHTLPQLEVTCTPAQHFSARTLWDRNRTLWSGFVLKTASGSIYFAGDSAWCGSFETIGARLGPFDLSLIPIGAYEPRWFMGTVHMNPDEAVRAHLAVRSRRSIAMHFGTFQLTDEAIDAPLVALTEARTTHGVAAADFNALDFGETRLLALA
jgi:L-ascorbate metabolism protein UlaG (beta-lactamase superfamily)